MRKTLFSVALAAALGVACTAAQAIVLPDFQVTEGSVPLANANTFTADKITGNYVEVITFTGANTFTVSLVWQAGQYVGNDGTTPVSSQVAVPGGGVSNNQYGLYALYQSGGTFSTDVNGITTFTDTAGVGSLSVYIDRQTNTTFTQPASGADLWGTANAADDYLIATGTPLGGTGTLDPFLPTCGSGGINCGSFGTSTSFALTTGIGNLNGTHYFTSPVPFYNLSFQSGQLDNFNLSGQQVINGSLDVVFNRTPEPATLALLGIGILGLGFSARRKQG